MSVLVQIRDNPVYLIRELHGRSSRIVTAPCDHPRCAVIGRVLSFARQKMGLLHIFSYGFILQALAIVHFIRRRPDTYWLFIIIFLGPLGALIYLAVEALPDLGLLRTELKIFPRRRRIREVEALVRDNPSPGNYEELGDLYYQDGNLRRCRECYDRAISSRTDSIDPFYRRGLCELGLSDFAAAIPDLERVIAQDPNYDFHRAAGLLAHAYTRAGHPEKAAPLFDRVMRLSTLTELQYYYAAFLASQGRTADAREFAERIMQKKNTLPGFQRRRDRPWFRKTAALLKGLK